jgi:hypothetical protein
MRVAPAAGAAASVDGPWRKLVGVSVAVAALLCAAVVVQWQQNRLLTEQALSHGDNTAFQIFQAEHEYLRLTALWPHAGLEELDLDALRLRYEIFVSRIRLLERGTNLAALMERDELANGLRESQQLIARLDPLLAADAAPVPVDRLVAERPALQAVAPGLRTLSRRSFEVMNQNLSDRTESVQSHNRLALAMTGLLGATVVLFGTVAARQLLTAHRRQRQLELLSAQLEQARADAERASQAKSEFLANMSHEIRTPFQGLIGMLGLLDTSTRDPSARRLLDTARSSADHLLALLNDILDLSRLETGSLQIDRRPTALRGLLQAVQALMEPQVRRKALDWRMSVADGVPDRVDLDPTRVRQVLFNLLGNAVKFTERGQVSLDVAVIETDGGLPHLRFTAADTGIGMDAATLARLFSRFSQGDASRTRRFGGSGLGLEISRRLARIMGGDITVDSQPGVGSRFVFTLPLKAAEDDHPLDEPAGLPTTLPPLRLLVAEDNPVNCLVLQAMLEGQGHSVEFAQDGLTVVERARSARFDVVLMDLHMPGQDGLAAAAAIRALPDPLQATVPLVAFTADAFEETRQRCLAAGMDGFLTKPVTPQGLADGLARTLRRTVEAREARAVGRADSAAATAYAP